MMTRNADNRPACPRHAAPLDGGPVLFNCPEGHAVYAADLDNEFVPALAVTR